MREIIPGVIQLKIPLPGIPLKYLNSYLIKGKEHNLIIDTGINSDEAFNSLVYQLDKLGLKLRDLTEVVVTHLHIDHIGLVPKLKSVADIKFLMSEDDSTLLDLAESNTFLQELLMSYIYHGVPQKLLAQLLEVHPAKQLKVQKIHKRDILLKNGDELSIDDYEFQVILTPGHTPGHICLYEPNLKVLISGDHILPTITPVVLWQIFYDNPLKDYLSSLDKVMQLDVEIVLPAHGDVFMTCKDRIDELKKHHEHRLNEILDKIRGTALTAYQIAQSITWNVKYHSWDDFPLYEKYFAISETIAHLKFLQYRGFVEEIKHDDLIRYRATTSEAIRVTR